MRSATLTPIASTGSFDPAAASSSGLFRTVILRLLRAPGPGIVIEKSQQRLKQVTLACSRNGRQTSPARAMRSLLVQLSDAVQPIEGRHFVALRQRRIVKDRLDEVIQFAAKHHHRLADMQQLACTFADDVHAKNRVVLAVENQL